MNVAKVAFFPCFAKGCSFNNESSFKGGMVHEVERQFRTPLLTADNVIKGSVAGSILGVICSCESKTAKSLAKNALKGAAAVLLVLLGVKSISKLLGKKD